MIMFLQSLMITTTTRTTAEGILREDGILSRLALLDSSLIDAGSDVRRRRWQLGGKRTMTIFF